ncbi:MAG: MFS transporter [Candidatus Aminicenantes bacterium]|jgi:MFS family permease
MHSYKYYREILLSINIGSSQSTLDFSPNHDSISTVSINDFYEIPTHMEVKPLDRTNLIERSVKRPWYLLAVIVIAQFAGTSLWFAGNAIIADLSESFHLTSGAVGDLTASVQFGFIGGTLCFAILAIADRISPRTVFLACAILGAFFNLMIYLAPLGYFSLLAYRLLTGFFLAGIYPVGMKIAADWYEDKLGHTLGFLVGALVVGTGFPHLVKSIGVGLPWQTVLLVVSSVAALGGILLFCLIKDGPYRKTSKKFKASDFLQIFAIKDFRSAAFGYFGHMWELYAFWTFVPALLLRYVERQPGTHINSPLWTFLIIASGFFGCAIGGILSIKIGSTRVAFIQLLISGLCCIFVLVLYQFHVIIFLTFLLLWGVTVVGDSPQYSTLVARTAPKELTGTALTITNCIGFSITIVSIQLIKYLNIAGTIERAMIWLAIGPMIGLVSIFRLMPKRI